MDAARRWLVLLAAAAATVTLTSDAVADRTFGPRLPFTINTQGDITIAANSILTCVDDQGGVCAAARIGTATPASANNNNRAMTWIDVDGDPETFNSSSPS